MSKITDMFSQKVLLDYSQNRQMAPLLGETLFPERKIQGLEFEYLRGGSSLPVAAKVHAFDTEAEIGSREVQKSAGELALIKRKMQLKEKDIIALNNPRNVQEAMFLKQNVFNDIDALVNSVRAGIEKMRMEVLAKGKITLDSDNNKTIVDYNVPEEHKAIANWNDDSVNPLEDIMTWIDRMDDTPTRALTSTKVLRTIMRNKNVITTIFGSNTGKILTPVEFDNFMKANGLPVIKAYDKKYRVQSANGFTTNRYFDENAFAMFGDNMLGETVYGTTAEEIRLSQNPEFDTNAVGNILTTVYEQSGDPVSTWEKAVATALPSFAEADNVFQATITTGNTAPASSATAPKQPAEA